MANNKQKNTWFLKVGLVLTAFMVAVILIGQFWTPYDPAEQNVAAKSLSPSLAHLMGTDYLGRDIFSRAMEGAGTTLFIAFFVVLLGSAAGILVGALTRASCSRSSF